MAASAAATRPAGFPFDRLKGMPILICHGDQDDEVPVPARGIWLRQPRRRDSIRSIWKYPARRPDHCGAGGTEGFRVLRQHPHKGSSAQQGRNGQMQARFGADGGAEGPMSPQG